MDSQPPGEFQLIFQLIFQLLESQESQLKDKAN